jgi:hypothetical protein
MIVSLTNVRFCCSVLQILVCSNHLIRRFVAMIVPFVADPSLFLRERPPPPPSRKPSSWSTKIASPLSWSATNFYLGFESRATPKSIGCRSGSACFLDNVSIDTFVARTMTSLERFQDSFWVKQGFTCDHFSEASIVMQHRRKPRKVGGPLKTSSSSEQRTGSHNMNVLQLSGVVLQLSEKVDNYSI